MHIPDNYLSPQTDAVFTVAMVPIWVHCTRKVTETLNRKQLSFLGMAGAFSFLLMMFNVPLPGGTTGHAVGGTLIALLLGPHAACLAVSVALGIQALIFGDGGILAFGANCFNMAFVLPFVGYAVYKLARGKAPAPAGRRMLAAFVGSYAGLAVAALCAAIEFGVQPLLFTDASGAALYCPYPLSVSLPAMMIPHLLVACVIEGVATVTIHEFVLRTAPEYTIEAESQNAKGGSLTAVAVLVGVLALATPLGLLAQGTAWGEWGTDEIAEIAGLSQAPAGMAGGFEWQSLMPDYTLGALPEVAAYILSAVIGVALLVIIFRLIASFVPARQA